MKRWKHSVACEIALVAAALGATGCVGSTPDDRFLVAPLSDVAVFERTRARDPLDLLLDPEFSVPVNLCPCCAFGRDLGVSVASLPGQARSALARREALRWEEQYLLPMKDGRG